MIPLLALCRLVQVIRRLGWSPALWALHTVGTKASPHPSTSAPTSPPHAYLLCTHPDTHEGHRPGSASTSTDDFIHGESAGTLRESPLMALL